MVNHLMQYQVPLCHLLETDSSIKPYVFYVTLQGIKNSFNTDSNCLIIDDNPLLDVSQHKFSYNILPKLSPSSFFGTISPSSIIGICSCSLDAIVLPSRNGICNWLRSATSTLVNLLCTLLEEFQSHSDVNPYLGFKLKYKTIESLLQNAYTIWAVGSLNRQLYIDCKVPSFKIFNTPNAMDTERFDQTRHLNINPDLPSVQNSAEHQSWKRSIDLAKTDDLLDKSVDLVVTDDMPLTDEINRQTTYRSWIKIPKFVNQSELGERLGATDISTLLSDHEVCGLVVIIALLVGTFPWYQIKSALDQI